MSRKNENRTNWKQNWCKRNMERQVRVEIGLVVVVGKCGNNDDKMEIKRGYLDR